MLKLIGDLIYGIGWLVGAIKYRLGIVVHVPEWYRRSSRFGEDGDEPE